MTEKQMRATYLKTFVGICHAVCLTYRNPPHDKHVRITILTEDDGNWSESEGSSFSSYWVNELAKLLLEARDWMIQNCEPDISNGTQYGWRFQ